jgi:vanillate O-demethylase ferredoxin subunit
MAEELHCAGRDFTLHYCARFAVSAAFVGMLRATPYGDRVVLHFDDGDAAQKLDLDAVLTGADRDTHLYVCGPAGFMGWVIDTAVAAGWPDAQVHREYFKADAPLAQARDGAFEVRLARSGRVFNVPADRSIAAVLIEAGVDLPVSCESGVCGTCLCSVLEGMPDHRDYFLTAEEKAAGNQMLPCCSRASSPLLVLDL